MFRQIDAGFAAHQCMSERDNMQGDEKEQGRGQQLQEFFRDSAGQFTHDGFSVFMQLKQGLTNTRSRYISELCLDQFEVQLRIRHPLVFLLHLLPHLLLCLKSLHDFGRSCADFIEC